MLSIGDLARATGANVQTIRYYERIGLMAEPQRTEGGQRRYDEAALDRLAFIRHGRQLGFSLDSIRDLLGLADAPDHSCAHIDAIASKQLHAVETRIARLELLRAELARMVEECSGGKVADCRVLGVLRDHGECLSDH